MKKIWLAIISVALVSVMLFAFVGCADNNGESDITVVAREAASGTREAFEEIVGDGTTTLLYKDANGNKISALTSSAVILSKTGDVKTKVASDKNAIGYISLGSVDSSVKVLSVEGVTPSAATVLDGTYKIQRPFVIMTNNSVTLNALAADFLAYLKSTAMSEHCNTVGTVFLEDASLRGTDAPAAFTKQASLPAGTVVIRGSTSMETLINAAISGYMKLYGVDSADITDYFDIDLKGSSVGKTAADEDTAGNVIGLASSAKSGDKINTFNVCLDAVAVVVNKENSAVSNVTLAQLYKIYTGALTKFGELSE